ncbi:hypothetical protein [Variovorax terrae]|uniref:Uncharacterized protein n=1 Tax=Variovorax terrae TaxID=2923278 RepID=A0A9X1VZX3_9BURK|nr:hypothetical protein [Variovorax terrae]MCJ0763538.1 hypothetical protein [Variovorax terrae]
MKMNAEETAAIDSLHLDSSAGIFPEWLARCSVCITSLRLRARPASEPSGELKK